MGWEWGGDGGWTSLMEFIYTLYNLVTCQARLTVGGSGLCRRFEGDVGETSKRRGGDNDNVIMCVCVCVCARACVSRERERDRDRERGIAAANENRP